MDEEDRLRARRCEEDPSPENQLRMLRGHYPLDHPRRFLNAFSKEALVQARYIFSGLGTKYQLIGWYDIRGARSGRMSGGQSYASEQLAQAYRLAGNHITQSFGWRNTTWPFLHDEVMTRLTVSKDQAEEAWKKIMAQYPTLESLCRLYAEGYLNERRDVSHETNRSQDDAGHGSRAPAHGLT